MDTKITLSKIAQDLGYSMSTVSRAISGKGRVSPETKKRILKYCQVSGYRNASLSHTGHSLRTYNLAAVLPADQELLEIPFFHNCIMGMDSAAKKMGYNILLVSLESHDISPLEHVLAQQKVDGVLLLRTLVKDDTVEYLLSMHIPFLTVGQPNYASVQYVDCDIIRACKEMMAYLTEQKQMWRIALVGGDANHTVTQKRIMGFREGLLLHNRKILDDMIYLNCCTKEKVYQAIEELVEKCAECIVCMDDKICRQAMMKLQNMHINVPKDMEVASLYNSAFLKEYASIITTLEFDERALGMLACEKLINRMERGDCNSKVFTNYSLFRRLSAK